MLSLEVELEGSNYTAIAPIGRGGSAVVWVGRNKQTGERVAIKRICMAARATGRQWQRIVREVAIMRHFRHENLVGLRDVIVSDTAVLVVMELMQTDLSRMVASGRPFAADEVQLLIYQILRGLKCLHSAQVVHRDLKPQNCVVNRSCDLKICDFGTGRGTSGADLTYAEDLTTLWYCAPESLVESKSYDSAVDVWSVGCIMAELLNGYPLFCGKDRLEQLSLIVNLLGTAPDEYTSNRELRRHLRFVSVAAKPLADAIPSASVSALDLLSKLLVLDPRNRISVSDALRHPYLACLHDPEDEPVAPIFYEQKSCVAMDTCRSTVFGSSVMPLDEYGPAIDL